MATETENARIASVPRSRILLIGPNGQLGWELLRCLQPLGEIVVASSSPLHKDSLIQLRPLDLANPDAIAPLLDEVRPALIVNAAAYTAVDQTEEEEDLAHRINGIAPGILAEQARRIGAGLIHYSTDYVFDGKKEPPYTEGDATGPINIYGKTKLAGNWLSRPREFHISSSAPVGCMAFGEEISCLQSSDYWKRGMPCAS